MGRNAFDHFQPPLPINHSFFNAPYKLCIQKSTECFVNPLTEALTNNTPTTSALSTHVGVAPAPHTHQQ